jgi:hypothetical protein
MSASRAPAVADNAASNDRGHRRDHEPETVPRPRPAGGSAMTPPSYGLDCIDRSSGAGQPPGYSAPAATPTLMRSAAPPAVAPMPLAGAPPAEEPVVAPAAAHASVAAGAPPPAAPPPSAPPPAPPGGRAIPIGRRNDPLEDEADRLADRMLAMPAGAFPALTSVTPTETPGALHRACAACEDEEKLHRKAGDGGDAMAAAPPSVHAVLGSPGEALPHGVRSFFEPRLGTDLSGVQVHTGPRAEASARDVNALAYTVGSHIVFDSGRYQPGSTSGDRLLAHELAHVVQHGAPALRRAPGDDDPLTAITLTLVSKDPPTWRATFAFTKKPVSFEVSIHGEFGMKTGTQPVSATPMTLPEGVPSDAVLFTLPDSNSYIWFKANPETAPHLVRASVFLQAHDPVTLTIVDGTQAKGDGGENTKDSNGLGMTITGDPKGEKDAKDSGGPRVADPEPWLLNEMMPAVRAALASGYPATKLGTLIPYTSLNVQEKEGPDILMIQVNKPGSKEIAGHVRADRRKWVGQEAGARTAYAAQTAAAIVAVLSATARKAHLKELDADLAKSSEGETFPAWAITLKLALDKKIAGLRAAAPPGKPSQDLPDRLTLVHLGDMTYLQLILEREAENAPGKMVFQSGVMAPSLAEEDAKAIDAMMVRIREQTALMRTRGVKFVEKSDEPDRMDILMQPIAAHIRPLNLNASGATTTGATNSFRMAVHIEDFQANPSVFNWDTVAINEQLGLREVDFTWKVIPFTTANAEDLVREPPPATKEQPPWKRSDVYFDLANREIDEASKIKVATQNVDLAKVMASTAYPLTDTNHGTLEHEFSKIPGVYLVIAEVLPRPMVNDKTRRIFPPSRAVFPVRVLSSADLARETTQQAPNALAAKERQKADPNLTDHQRLQIDADIDKMTKQEGMSQLQITRQAETDLGGKIATFTALRDWLIADRKVNKTTVGTATEDPLLVRLIIQDRRHDTHFYDAFMELQSNYGEHAYDISYLAEPIESDLGQLHVLNQHLKLLGVQKTEADKMAKRIEGAEHFVAGSTQQTVATLVVDETGLVTPLLLLVGLDDRAETGKFRYRIFDLTLSATPLFKPSDSIYIGSNEDTREEALHSAFVKFGRDNEYPEGNVFYRFAGETKQNSVPNIVTAWEDVKRAAMILAILGMIAAVVASAGTATPAVAAVIGAITVANAALAIATSSASLLHRSEVGRLELDVDSIMDVVNIIASLVGLGALKRGAQLGAIAKEAEAAGDMARAAAAIGKLETMGRNVLLFDTAVLGATAVLTGYKVVKDISAVKALHLPKAEEEAALKQVTSDAAMQGAMMAFQTVMLARSHLEMYQNRAEAGRYKAMDERYKSMEERGWVDSEGRVTENAPPSLRPNAKPATSAVGETAPVSLESDLPRVAAAVERGEAVPLPKDPEHDLAIPFRDENNEPHQFKRRREDGSWCRYSVAPFCYINKKEIDKILKTIGALDDPPPPKLKDVQKAARKQAAEEAEGTTPVTPRTRAPAKGVPGKSWGGIGGDAETLTRTLEATVDQATIDVRKVIGKKWLPPKEYGTELHKMAAKLFRAMKLPRGWVAIVDKPLRLSGQLDPAIANMTVREFLELNAPWLLPEPNPGAGKKSYSGGVTKALLEKRIGNIEPDLVLVAPDGTRIVWDLAPGLTPDHLAKTLVYSNAVDSAGGRVQVGETYYHPERLVTVNSTEQARFQGKSATTEGARVTLKDEALLSLTKKWAGEGKPVAMDLPTDPVARDIVLKHMPTDPAKATEPLEQGYHGAVELVTGNDKIVGQFFDPKTKTWTDTTNFTIHYTEGGLFIRPEAP